ncbi:hypothetical protein CEXT_94791 [Caerostris extrusa]|uniref:Uncharacterized protein n=1 Tax=Caerostris extrusa TaxID=172846 RepID=A0AAV4QPB4_CAEEX|nr:hypothetical protein CEXT_94791 [Caerostris extrusa]
MCQLFRDHPLIPEIFLLNGHREKQIQVVKARESLPYFEAKQRGSISKQKHMPLLKPRILTLKRKCIKALNLLKSFIKYICVFTNMLLMTLGRHIFHQPSEHFKLWTWLYALLAFTQMDFNVAK